MVLNIHNIYKLQLSYWIPIKTYLKIFFLITITRNISLSMRNEDTASANFLRKG